MLKKFVKTRINIGTALLTLSAIIAAHSISQSAFAQTSDIRINSIRIEETLVAETLNGYFEVSDRNTTVSAFGGRMRLYDVHMARMIALSHHFHCAQPTIGGIPKTMTWEYRANNGRIKMGNFSLPCNQVEQAVKTYGLGRSVPMQVHLTDGSQKIVNVRVLDIQGDAETNRFLDFVQTIKPQNWD